MRRTIPILSALCLLAGAAFAIIVDSIVVTVGTQAITASELELTIRLTTFLNQAPIDFSTANRRKTVERLIEQRIVLKELDFSRFPRPSMQEVEPRLRTIINLLFADNQDTYRGALGKYGITEDDLKRYLLWQSTFFGFIDFRFRPGIQVTDAEIEDYFKSRILPLAQKANPGKTISLDEYHDRIERILMARHEEVEMQGWLAETRKRTKIEYRDEELKPEPADGGSKPAAGSSKPSGAAPKPAVGAPKPADAPKPAAGTPKPADAAPKPAESLPKPADAAPKPAEGATEPADAAPKPAESLPKPADAAPKPAEDAPKPADAAPKPAEGATEPADAAPKPAESLPKPADAAPKPAEGAPKPVDAAPKPAEDAPKPADAAPKPAEGATEPADAAPKPAERAPK